MHSKAPGRLDAGIVLVSSRVSSRGASSSADYVLSCGAWNPGTESWLLLVYGARLQSHAKTVVVVQVKC